MCLFLISRIPLQFIYTICDSIVVKCWTVTNRTNNNKNTKKQHANEAVVGQEEEINGFTQRFSAKQVTLWQNHDNK